MACQCSNDFGVLFNEQAEAHQRWMGRLLFQLGQTTTQGFDKALEIPHLFLSAGMPPPLCAFQFEAS